MDLVCLGELLIDFVPSVVGAHLRDVPSFQKAAGGAPANVAAGFSRLGGRSSFVGKVGEDEFGRFLEETLIQAGVDTTHLCKTREALTGLAFVSLAADGERDFLFYRNPAADALLASDEVDETLIRECRIFHFGTISLGEAPARAATLKAAEVARRADRLVSFDPNLRPALWPDQAAMREAVRTGLNYATILKVSAEELEFITGSPAEVFAVEGLFQSNTGLRLIVITLGKDGCRLYLRDQSVSVPGYAVSPVDATGAGDGFTAGLLFVLNEHLRQHPDDVLWEQSQTFWWQAGRFANAVGALVLTRQGGIPAMPDYHEVARFLEHGRGF